MTKTLKLKLLIFLNTLVILGVFSFSVFANDIGLLNSNQIQNNKKSYVEGEVIVKYKDNKINLNSSSGIYKAQSINISTDTEKKEDLPSINSEVLIIKDGSTVEDKITELQSDPNVEYAQPNYQYYPSTINTDDTYKTNMWGLDNTGQTLTVPFMGVGTMSFPTTPDADMDAPEAWNINEGTNSSVIVAVIDSGVAYLHPDLINQMWDGTNCKDESGNFLGGCNHGYDYENNDKTPLPTSSAHGTHVAGIIAAEKNNGKGIIGIAPHSKIMAIKINFTTSSAIKAINFAKQNGAKIINASWGGNTEDPLLLDAISSFNGLFISSAGNCGDSNYAANNCSYQNQPQYPASSILDNIISVAATSYDDSLASFSNNSPTSVDVGAPGVYVYSTVTLTGDGSDEVYDWMNGTSMASPYVAGLAALIKGYSPNLTNAQIKNIILATGDSKASLSSTTVTGKRINAQKALENIKSIIGFTAPNQVGNTIIDELNHTISISVPYATDVTSLSPIIAISGSSINPNSLISQDFTNPVTYTVTAIDNSTQNYLITVNIAPDPDIAFVASDKSSLTDSSILNQNQDISHITTSLTLLTSGSNGSSITWSSDNTSVVSNTGIVIRPIYGTPDANVTLTATLTKGAVTDIKTFNLLVLAITVNPDIAFVASDKSSLTDSSILNQNQDISHITTSLTLLTSGSNGSSITWSSDNTSVVSNTGIVIRPAYGQLNVRVNLMATLTKGSVIDTQVFSLLILAETVNPSPIVSSGGGGGGGGSSYTPPTVVVKPIVTSVITTPIITKSEIIPTTLPKEELTTTPLITFTKVLKINSKGAEVKQLQSILITNKYLSGKADGIFGKQTKLAIMKFQKDHNLIPDGIVGMKTLKEMK